MKIATPLTFCCMLSLAALCQTNDLNLAVIAWEKGHFDNAWKNANAALASPASLDESSRNRALTIRGKAGSRMAYNTLTKGEEIDLDKTVGIALQSFHDFKEILNTKDSALIKEVSSEFYKLGHALLLSGNDVAAKNADAEKPDEALTDKSIECYSATIELWTLAGKEKYKPYYYRGDALLEKKQYERAVEDLEKAMAMFIAATRKTPDLGIGDLGYRLAYTQAGIFNNKAAALATIAKTKELLEAEMHLAESKRDKLADIYEDIKTQYDYLLGELNSLEKSASK